MKTFMINEILNRMTTHLDDEQFLKLETALYAVTEGLNITKEETALVVDDRANERILKTFLACKRLENCSEGTIEKYYECLDRLLKTLNKNIDTINVNDLRCYLAMYKEQRKVSLSYLETLRHIITSFFTWANLEGYIQINPALRLKRVKVPEMVRKPFTPLELEVLKRSTENRRDLAIIEVLMSTGMRIGELVAINRNQICFENKDILIYGQKGKKERYVYLTDSACFHLKKYLDERTDDNEALFVNRNQYADRLTADAIRVMFRRLGKVTGIDDVHPHRFRRTMASSALERGFPIEQVQEILGHKKIDTTRIYCTVKENTVRSNFSKLMAS